MKRVQTNPRIDLNQAIDVTMTVGELLTIYAMVGSSGADYQKKSLDELALQLPKEGKILREQLFTSGDTTDTVYDGASEILRELGVEVI